MADKRTNYAVITGAGKGLGLAFAENLSKRGHNVILVSLPGENLEEQCRKLETDYGISAAFYEADLTKTGEIDNLADWISKQYSVDILINNAGFGGSGEFGEEDILNIDSMILLNVRATTWLIHKMLPLLNRHNDSYVLNVSSMASFSPIGYKSVYAATKVYIEYLSRGLNIELRKKGVHISSVHPGPMPTNEEVRNRIRKQSGFGKLGTEEPAYIAAKAIDRMFRRNSQMVIGKGNRFHWALMKTLPRRLVIALLSNGVKKEISR
jgi:uncharacterized protein